MPRDQESDETRGRYLARGPSFSSTLESLLGVILLLLATGFVLTMSNGLTGMAALDVSTPDGLFTVIQIGANASNQYHDQIPSMFASLFGNERIIGTVTLNSGQTLVVGAVTENAWIRSLTKGEINDPTLRVYLNENTVRKILSSSNPPQAVTEALNNGDITYQAETFTGSVKYGTASLAARVASWFGW